jgi:hypothetical protein
LKEGHDLGLYDSPGYRAVLKLLGTGSVERDFRIVEAV